MIFMKITDFKPFLRILESILFDPQYGNLPKTRCITRKILLQLSHSGLDYFIELNPGLRFATAWADMCRIFNPL